MEALCMMMIFLLNKKKFPSLFITPTIKSDSTKKRHFITAYKECNSIVRMCQADLCKNLTHFCQEVQKLKFHSAPNYERLRKMLMDLYSFEQNQAFGSFY